METTQNSIDVLLEKAEQYGKTSLELFKLKAIEKTSNTISKLVIYCIAASVLMMFAIAANIGLALWLGDLLNKTYYGFFCVAGFYFIVGCVLLFVMKNAIKTKVGNSIILKMLN
ncbi:MAG: phage holin family protein [Chitinophagaceae bacterium]